MAQVPSATPAATPARTHALGSYHRKSSGSSDAANSGESPLGSDKHSCPIARLMKRTGYSIVQENGQRRYGPPPDWEGEAPSGGCEVCVNKIPRDCFEDELVPVFDRIGKIYELRLIMDYIGLNKGYAFVVYGDVASAKESARQLNNYEIRKGRTLSVCMTVDNCRLFVRGIPKKVTKERIKQKVQEVTEGVVDVIVYHSAIDKTKNKGFAFVEYDRHQAAVMALWNLRHGRLFLWGNQLHVDWATPDLEVDKEIMAQVKVQYIRNLMLSTTESTIEEVFSVHAPVNQVKKIIDHALVYFHSKEDAHKAMNQLNGSILDGAEIQVMLAKPTRKTGLDASQRTPKFNRIATLPAVGSAIYPASSYSITPKFSLGECTKVRMCGNRGRNFLPSQMVQPNQGLAMPSPLYTATQGFGGGYMPLPGAGYAEPPTSFSAAAAGAITQGVIIPKPHKNAVQFLEEVCAKSSWPPPVYTLHTPSTGDTRFFVYKVALTSIGVAYMPEKLSRTIEEAKSAAAEYTLSQLGYCSEVRVTASSYPALPTQPLPLTNTATGYAAPSVPTAYNPHPTTAATAAIYLFPDPYQQIYGSP